MATATGRPELEMEFIPAARGRRGLVALVEAEGDIHTGDEAQVIKKAK